METQKIKAVLLAAEYKSLSKAAEKFSYTPSALSHSVDSLENELGIKLLERSHSGVELSSEGKSLYDKLEAVIKAESELKKSAAMISKQKAGLLRIATYSSISFAVLPELLSGFHRKYPEINISILIGDDIDTWLDTDDADVVFGVQSPGHEWLPVIEDEYVAVVPEGAFNERQKIEIEDLYTYPFITTKNVSATRLLDLQRFKEIIRLDSDDDMPAISMVSKGMGVTILPTLSLENRQVGIRTFSLPERAYRSLGLVYKKEPGYVALNFIQYLKQKSLS